MIIAYVTTSWSCTLICGFGLFLQISLLWHEDMVVKIAVDWQLAIYSDRDSFVCDQHVEGLYVCDVVKAFVHAEHCRQVE